MILKSKFGFLNFRFRSLSCARIDVTNYGRELPKFLMNVMPPNSGHNSPFSPEEELGSFLRHVVVFLPHSQRYKPEHNTSNFHGHLKFIS